MTYVLIGLRRSGKCLPTLFACANFRFHPSGSSSTAPMSFLQECLLRKSCTPGLPFFSLPSSEGRDGGGWSQDALVLLSEGFPLPPLDFGPAGGVEEPLVARSVHGSSLLSRFIRGLGIQELLSCGGLLLPVLSRLAPPPHLCTLGEVVGRESLRGLSLLSVASLASSLHAW